MQQDALPVQPTRLPRSVAFVRQQFSQFGGAELILDRTIDALAARGVGVKLVARSWNEKKGVNFIPVNAARFPRATRDSRFAVAACAALTNLRDTLVQSHERIECCDIFRAGDGVHAAYLAHRARGMNAVSRFFQSISGYHRDVLRLEQRMFESRRLKAVIVNSNMVADEIVQYYAFPRERIHLIPSGIDLEKYNPRVRDTYRKATREKLGAADDRKILLLVGSGYARKGLKSAILALAESKLDADLWVVGSEREPSAFAAIARRAGIGDRLKILGAQKDVIPFFAAADALVLPSVYDPFPSAILEALACGLPVVTSDNCGARDAVRKLDPSLVRDAYDVGGLAEAFGKALMLASSPDTTSMCRAIAEGYRVDVMAERMLALYERVANEKAR